tara:strand:- start:100416 stop:101180 length:765 start_codon:yes stop_codon:yes gene_type:complete
MKNSLILLSLIFINSCNVASVLTGAETDLGNNFSTDLTNGLDFFARLDSSGDQYTSFNNIILTNTFTATQTSGKNGGAIQCDSAGIGNADCALKDASTNIVYPSGQNFAVAFWLKADTTYTSISSGTIFTDDNGTLQVSFGDIDGSSDTNDLRINVNAMTSQYNNMPISLGQWNHIAVNLINGGDSREVYLNGNFYASSSGHSAMNVNATGICLCSSYIGGNEFEGAIDSFGLWNRNLSTDEIKALYTGNNNVD